MGGWIQTHRTTFLVLAGLLMAASLAAAIREKIVKGKNTGLFIFGAALISMAALLTYRQFASGYPF